MLGVHLTTERILGLSIPLENNNLLGVKKTQGQNTIKAQKNRTQRHGQREVA